MPRCTPRPLLQICYVGLFIGGMHALCGVPKNVFSGRLYQYPVSKPIDHSRMQVKDIISRTLMPCVPGHSSLSSGLSSVPTGPIQSEDADDVLTSAPPPAHWDPMRKEERIGVKMLVLPLPGMRIRFRRAERLPNLSRHMRHRSMRFQIP